MDILLLLILVSVAPMWMLHALLAALSRGEWEEAAGAVRQGAESSDAHWPPERFAQCLAPFLERFGRIVFDHRARLADKTTVRPAGELRWEASQVVCDPEGEDLWCVEATVDLSDLEHLDGPIIAVKRIGT